MDFFNSLLIRVTLAVIGRIFYAFLAYTILILMGLASELVIPAAVLVYLFYLGSRLLLLFSGIDSPYYSREREKGLQRYLLERIPSPSQPNGSENSIAFTTPLFLFFLASCLFFFSSLS